MPLIGGLLLIIAAAAANDTQDVLITDLMKWLRDNGSFINDKLQIRHINPNDPKSPRGVFALESLEEGETVCNIPWDLVIKPSKDTKSQKEKSRESDCGTINAVIEELGKSESEMTPYGKYLLSQQRGYTVGFWSKEGQELFWEMTDDERLPPIWIEESLEEWEDYCDGDEEIDDHVFALMLVKARADYQYLVPFYDMMNHNNGKTNVIHKYDPYKGDPIHETGYEMVTSKPISAGEELFLSYNHCKICQQYYDWFGTPEMFRHFGFVESYPQRWLFDFARVKFDLDWKDGDEGTGEVVVNFLVPPSKKGMDLLKHEVDRLEKFGQRREQSSNGEVPEYELNSLWEYYDALHGALRYALESNATLVDDVWSMGEDWWVKDGTLKAEDVDEHCVRQWKENDKDEL
mmetsp:Transcript_8925/g.14728  ORF Transcript_8925/g.14728 Transcript_8925/m.14728 type:complete len:404 (-) Transcript_8925:393-1604(-)